MKRHFILITAGFLLSFLLLFAFASKPLEDEAAVVVKKEKRVCDKGLYVTYWTTTLKKRFAEIKAQAKAAGLNTIVVDVKQTIENQIVPLAKAKQLDEKVEVQPDPWLKELVKELHDEGFIVSGRIVVFKDDHLAIIRPDLAVKNEEGNLYRDNKQGRWVDPYSREVRLYNQLIAEIAARSGIDEVEYDYVRFPAEGGAAGIVSNFSSGESKVETITLFLKETKERLAKYNVSLAVDIFGVTAWQSQYDVVTLGQSIEAMAEHIDAICPMLYPSHFHRGYDGYAFPGNEPYYFINTGVKKCKEKLAGKNVKIVPWIQGFAWGTTIFGRNYIAEQIRAVNDEGLDAYLIWNAGNRYDQLPNQP